MRLKLLLLVTLLFGLFLESSAQDTAELFIRVVDEKTKQPISYATVRFGDTRQGIIANEKGDFRLPLTFKLQNRTVIISSIGFQTHTVSVGDLNENIINTIYLKTKIEELDAVLISGTRRKGKRNESKTERLSVEEIIRNAIREIPTNYPYQPHSAIAYYRDYQVVNDNYYNLNEGIVEIFDSGFNTNKLVYKNNHTALYSYDLNTEFYQDTLLLYSAYGKSKKLAGDNSAKLGIETLNELEILNIHNPIRNFDKNTFSSVYVFKDDFIKNHDFKISRITYVENEPLYEIEFITNEEAKIRYFGVGKIYISKLNYAIHKLEYRVFDVGRDFQRVNLTTHLKNEVSLKGKETLFEVTIEYKSIGSKMYLNYMTFNNRFLLKEPNPFKLEEMSFNSNDKRFYLTFNKPLDESSIKRKRNFKLYYKKKKLVIKDVELIEENKLRVDVVSWSAGEKVNIRNVSGDQFSCKLSRIKDILGGTINKPFRLTGYQFREFFTQEIFEDKTIESNLIYVDKTLPLSVSKLNEPSFDITKYWMNSPLKTTNN